jgi:uncharacterized protein
MKYLTDAGYNALAYDIRNHGNSGAANGGLSGIGQREWRDCGGVKKYVDSHPRLSKMKVGLSQQTRARLRSDVRSKRRYHSATGRSR